jgi:glyoxylate/hydroxypyruvate reductase A
VTDDGGVTVLIASPLEAEHVERIAAVDESRLRVLFAPELLPTPRYEGDHHGTPRRLTESEQVHWNALTEQAEVMFDFDWLDPSTLPERAPRLRWLQATSAGIGELVARSGLASSEIQFTTAAGVHASALAEFALLGLLYWIKDVPFLQRRQAEKRWERYTAESLADRRVLVVGLGAVGGQIARSCAALGAEVWGMRRSNDGSPPDGVARLISQRELHDALPAVDALILACPLTPETSGLIGRPELEALSQKAVFVNLARGAVVDEEALIDVLRRKQIRGAALDVFTQEPLPHESPLWELPNVLVSPHSASTVPDENRRIVDIFVDNLHRYLDGVPLRNTFERERGY